MIERAPFGATGHDSSRVIFGAAALGKVSKGDADRALDLLFEHGINHIDVAASYGDAELRIATWLRRNPDTFFVATKTGERTYRGAREEIRRSLDRLGVDRIDAIQLHNLVDVIEWETALGADGALEAAIEAREEGLVRFIGVTGHGLSVPEMHRRSLERFPFDSVLLPYNYVQMQDPRYAERFEALAAVCAERNVALQTIKSLALRRWDGRPPRPRPGTSRCASRRTSTSRRTGCSAAGGVPAHHRRRRDPAPPARRGRAVRRATDRRADGRARRPARGLRAVRLNHPQAGHSSGAPRISTYPSVRARGSAARPGSAGGVLTPTTAGRPYSRAITAPWVIRPPTSVTSAAIATNSGSSWGRCRR
jgi:aryl-alcohol dehydrogenase-like predicted oxidoreductase